MKPISDFGGKLTLGSNSALNHAKVLVEGSLVPKPESISVRGEEIFAGVKGKIVKVKNGKVSTVVQLSFPCSKELLKSIVSFLSLIIQFNTSSNFCISININLKAS